MKIRDVGWYVGGLVVFGIGWGFLYRLLLNQMAKFGSINRCSGPAYIARVSVGGDLWWSIVGLTLLFILYIALPFFARYRLKKTLPRFSNGTIFAVFLTGPFTLVLLWIVVVGLILMPPTKQFVLDCGPAGSVPIGNGEYITN